MQDLILVKNYKDNDVLRKSFFELASSVFGINFESWYRHGFWTERYIPYSFAEGEKIVANVSVNILDLIIHGESKSAIQIGTVMTHHEYRRNGLSSSLMNEVLKEYERKHDFIYLFANGTVMNFYPKFGFKAVEEHIFSIDYKPDQMAQHSIRKLDVTQVNDLSMIYKLASERLPVSNRFGTLNTEGIFMYYCLNVFNDDIYYLEEDDAIVLFNIEDGKLNIFDIVSRKEIRMQSILQKIAGKGVEQVVFHFTPDMDAERSIFHGGLFVKVSEKNEYPLHVKHPITSIA